MTDIAVAHTNIVGYIKKASKTAVLAKIRHESQKIHLKTYIEWFCHCRKSEVDLPTSKARLQDKSKDARAELDKKKVPELKKILRTLNLRIGKTKPDMLARLLVYYEMNRRIVGVQRLFRGQLARRFMSGHGPVVFKWKVHTDMCVNSSDTFTFEELADIPMKRFISYYDSNKFLYGFNCVALDNYRKSCDKRDVPVQNPYTREPMPRSFLRRLSSLLKYARLLGLNLEEDDATAAAKRYHTEIIHLCAAISYEDCPCNPEWFFKLTFDRMRYFGIQLAHIWNYRAELPEDIKYYICPYGNPCPYSYLKICETSTSFFDIKHTILRAITEIITTGINPASKHMGAMYVLGTLTLVCPEAKEKYPWLESVFSPQPPSAPVAVSSGAMAVDDSGDDADNESP